MSYGDALNQISCQASQTNPPASTNTPESNTDGPKRNAIVQSCEEKNVNSLISLATSEGGLLHDDLRKLACRNHFLFFFL